MRREEGTGDKDIEGRREDGISERIDLDDPQMIVAGPYCQLVTANAVDRNAWGWLERGEGKGVHMF